MSARKSRAVSSLWVLALGLLAAPGARAGGAAWTDFRLPAVALGELKADGPAPDAVAEPAAQPSLVDQWKNSVEYAVLLKQNGWKGWSYASAGRHPEIEWVEAFENPASEYRLQCAKSYDLAWAAVEAAARSRPGELAVVLDLDETVLLNLKFQQENVDVPFDPAKWDAWVRRQEAQAVPGAKEFLAKVRRLGPRVRLVFMSDRSSALDAFTAANMRALGLLEDADILLDKKDKADNKEVRRRCLTDGRDGTDERCKTYAPMTIVAKLGDSLRDHFEVYGRTAADATAGDARWGTEEFVLPNPMYGQWARDYK